MTADFAYMRGDDAWGQHDNEMAMDVAFGAGNWDNLYGYSVDVFAGDYDFIFIDGSNGNAAFLNFIQNNRQALEDWVSAGGTLFINAATSYPVDNFDLGFGVTLNAAFSFVGEAADPNSPIWTGPNGDAGTFWIGSLLSHNSVAGDGLNPLITSDVGTLLGEIEWGDGHVLFGGLTTNFFMTGEEWSPQPQMANLLANILDYAANPVAAQPPANHPPVVDAGANQTVNEGALVSVAAALTDADAGDGHTAMIDWGDGTTEVATISGGQVLGTHVYADDGAYTVTVTVTDEAGASSSDMLAVTVENLPPVVLAGADQTADEGEVVTISALVSDPGADALTVTVNWGDGSGEETVTLDNGVLTARHAYADDGLYTVTVTSTDEDGASGSDTLDVTVNNVAPTVAAGDGQRADEGAAVTIRPVVADVAADTQTVTVNWGDGSAEETVNLVNGELTATHVYADDGAYTATVTATDDDGGTTSDTLTVTVDNVAPVAVADQAEVLEDRSVMINVLANDSDAGALDQLSIASLSGARSALGASISIVDNQILYSADADLFDRLGIRGNASEVVDTLTYTVTDADGGVSTATVSVRVTADRDAGPVVLGNRGNAFTDVGEQDSILIGGNGSDTVDGGGGADELRGGTGADRLFGGDGDDLLFGEQGSDVLTGGRGADVFGFGQGGGTDTITDFELGVDHLLLDGITARSATFADVDNNGELDLLLQFSNGSVTLLNTGRVTNWADTLFA